MINIDIRHKPSLFIEVQDVYNDVKYALGMNISNSKRLKHSQDIQRKAEDNYGKENVTTLGQSYL